MPKPKFHIVVCTNSRPPGHPKPSCGAAGSPGVCQSNFFRLRSLVIATLVSQRTSWASKRTSSVLLAAVSKRPRFCASGSPGSRAFRRRAAERHADAGVRPRRAAPTVARTA